MDVSNVILPMLRYFILKICPELLRYFKIFIEIFEKENIDFVITSHQALVPEFSAIAAANYCKKTKS